MPEETNPEETNNAAATAASTNIKIVLSEAPGGMANVYSNHITLGITAYDVNLWFSKLVRLQQTDPLDPPVNQIERRALISLSWPEAKFLRNILSNAIENFEAVNGEINPTPKMPSSI